MPTIPSNTVVIDACARRLRALRDYVDPASRISLDGTKLPVPDVLAIYEECLASRAALDAQRALTQVALERRAAAEAARIRADRALRAWAANEFGTGTKEALAFGSRPRKPREQTVESKATSIARAKATRAARHTLGPRRKQEIRGTLPPPIIEAPHEEPREDAPLSFLLERP